MVKYFVLVPEAGRLSEITEGEYEFRLRKHTNYHSRPDIMAELLTPGHGFMTVYGSCFAVEMPDGKA